MQSHKSIRQLISPRQTRKSNNFLIAILGLWLLSIGMHLNGISHGPLRDWDESIVARISLEISQRNGAERFLPTLWGENYLNKPPGIHFLIGLAINSWRALSGESGSELPPEWIIRLAPSLIASSLPPLIAITQLKLRPNRHDIAIWAGVITLSLIPIVRNGHLAMLDNSQLVAMTLIWLGLLSAGNKSVNNLAVGVLVGAATSFLLMLKAPVALPVLIASLLIRALDRELKASSWQTLMLGISLGVLPGMCWHLMHWLERGSEAFHMWGGQGFARVTTSIEKHSGGPLTPIIQVLIGAWPWLPLWPAGVVMAWRNRTQSGFRWSLGLSLFSTLLVLPLQTQLPWYSLLLWPPFIFVVAPIQADLISGRLRSPLIKGIGTIWACLGISILLVILLSSLPTIQNNLGDVKIIALPAGIGLTVGGLLVARDLRRILGSGILIIGWLSSMFILFSTPLWNWELNENPHISQLIPLVKQIKDESTNILVTDGMEFRPSLAWYAGQEIRPWPVLTKKNLEKPFVVIAPTKSIESSALFLSGANKSLNCKLTKLSKNSSWASWLCRQSN